MEINPKRRIPLITTIGGVLSEMGHIYKEARRGLLPTMEAKQLAYILGEIRKVIEGTELEARLTELEAKAVADYRRTMQ
jgi:hypothetical protein